MADNEDLKYLISDRGGGGGGSLRGGGGGGGDDGGGRQKGNKEIGELYEVNLKTPTADPCKPDDCCNPPDCCHSNNHHPLSVQSGDIIRPPSPPLSDSHSRLYKFLFPRLLKLVRVVFFHERYSVVPIVIFTIYIAVAILLGLLVFLVFPLSYNISIESIQVPDHESSKNWDAYQAAVAKQFFNDSSVNYNIDTSSYMPDPTDNNAGGGGGNEGKSVDTSPSLGGEACCYEGSFDYHQHTMHGTWILELVYLGRHGQNLLEKEYLEHLHSIEEHIYNLPQYKKVCHFAYQNKVCDPVNSLLTYLYPRSVTDGSLEVEELPDNWRESVDTDSLTRQTAQSLLWYTGGNAGNTSLLRAQIRVGVPLPCYCSYTDRTEEQHEKVTNFFVSLIPFLDQASNSDIDVLYGGSEIFDYEVEQAKLHDLLLAIASGGIILMTMFVLTGFSVVMTLWGFFSLFLCWCISLFVYRVVLGYETFSLLTIVTVFVVIGIGVDDIFVFMNTYKQSAGLEGLDSIHKRITHTILVASSATFCTSATTAIAFLANAVSQIPAVRQFAIFTGLIVFFCFVNVVVTMPLFLHIWQSWIMPVEDFLLKLCLHTKNLCRRTKSTYSVVTAVRMTHLREEEVETDSGIIEDRNSDSTGSDSHSIESDSHSSTSSLVEDGGMEPVSEQNGTETGITLRQLGGGGDGTRTTSFRRIMRSPAIDAAFTEFLQKALLFTIARVVMLPQMVRYNFVSNRTLRRILRWGTRLAPVVLFVFIVVSMSGTMTQLKPSDHPPQLFDPDSNIQRMLDLQGNLTEREVINCWNCSSWYSHGTGGGGTTGGGGGGGSNTPDTPTHETTTDSTTTDKPTDAPPPSSSSSPPSSPPTTSSPSTSSSSSSSSSSPTQPTSSPSSEAPPTSSTDTPTSSSSSSSSSPTGSTTSTDKNTPPTATPTDPAHSAVDPDLINNVMVHVVFGLAGVKRDYSTSHVLPIDGEGRQAILDPSFSSLFTCPPSSSSSSSSLSTLVSTLKAMCRLCRNISNPENGLVLNGTFTCFPPELVNEIDSCIPGGGGLKGIEECQSILAGNKLISAQYNYTQTDDGAGGSALSLSYLAMTFKSTTSLSGSATDNIVQYEKWEEFLSSEMSEIQSLSAPDQMYAGSWDVIRNTFQASDYWVKVNTEIIAIRGSFYGILISIALCAVVVALLSHNWSVVLAMGLTILAILVTLLGLFKILGWRLGIIEAVSLSILVGNSLDYCIHLSEGYLATDRRHLVFLNKFMFTHNASPRVKKVLSAISFIGVSILSSALTTFLATLPLLGAKILLFTRFAQILILDTAVAILYTLFFCATFLSLFGPIGTSRSLCRVLNSVLTVSGTFVLMLVVYFVSTAIMSHYNII